MSERLRAVWFWLDERLGITDTVLPVILHPIPRGVGWWYILGSATLMAFILQVVTGVALAMVYVAAPDIAYQTVQFITNEAFLGHVIRGAHYFGAGAMVTLIFAHTTRVFLFGSYKYPREITWLTGSALLLLTLALAFTGQLLPWNQDAFWAVVVAAEQAGRVPIVGPLLMQVLVAGWTVGPATLSRFYATHVFLLPALLMLVVVVHLYLVVRLGISEPPKAGEPVDPKTYPQRYRELLNRGVPFFPHAVFQDAVGALSVVLVVLGLAALFGPPDLGPVADPTVVQAHPRPYWYFMWYYGLLASIPRISEALVIIGLPILIGMVLIALPLFANKGERSPRRRPWAVGSVFLVFLVFLALSWYGYRAPWAPVIVGFADIPFPADVTANLSPLEARGTQVFNVQACHACHSIGDSGGGVYGPALTTVGGRFSREQLVTTILHGRGNMPGYAGTISPDDLDALVAFLTTLRGTLPPEAT
ncbi:MAG: cytochrome b N-terminal domain-containing protein, partial [Chloroflexi bacterium]|nr:cytochrome b N-terminal domain-containing protein [Chloroflexota bacterium]